MCESKKIVVCLRVVNTALRPQKPDGLLGTERAPLTSSDTQSRELSDVYDLLDVLNNSTKFHINGGKYIEFSVNTVQHCCDLEIWSSSVKVV